MVINTQCALDLKCGEFSSNTDAGLITNLFPDTVTVAVEWFTPGSIALDFNRKDIQIFGGASFRTGIACGVIRIFLFDKWFVLPVTSVWELDRSGRRYVRCSYNVCPYESQTYFPSPSRQSSVAQSDSRASPKWCFVQPDGAGQVTAIAPPAVHAGGAHSA